MNIAGTDLSQGQYGYVDLGPGDSFAGRAHSVHIREATAFTTLTVVGGENVKLTGHLAQEYISGQFTVVTVNTGLVRVYKSGYQADTFTAAE